jgi:3-oxoacyl-[acyl-carrier-protein] synthase III
MRAVIRAVGSSVPVRRMGNDEFASFLETSDEWIHSHTGIRFRHIADPSQATSDLAYEAGRKALEKAGIEPSQLDMVLVATVSPDFIGFPSVSCILQDRLGAPGAGAMDIAAGCTGFIYGLETAKNFILGGGARTILVIGAEVLSRIANWQDRNTCVLFGDGAGAAVVQADDTPGDRGILRSSLRSDGSGARLLERTMGGTRFPFPAGAPDVSGSYLKMEGRQVYNFAVKTVAEGMTSLPALGGFTMDDIRWVVPHQANARIIEAAAKRAKVPPEKIFMNIQEYANTSAASIPIALSEMDAKGMLAPGDLLLTFGFGAGLTYGGNLIRW